MGPVLFVPWTRLALAAPTGGPASALSGADARSWVFQGQGMRSAGTECRRHALGRSLRQDRSHTWPSTTAACARC